VNGCMDVEDTSRYTAPPDDLDPERFGLTPYEEGRAARIDCEKLEDNPYFPSFAEERAEWDAGWKDANRGRWRPSNFNN